MDEDLLVLLEPRVESGPVEAHRVSELLDGRLVEHEGGTLAVVGADLESVDPGHAPGRPLGGAFVHEHLGVYVGHRHVVLREARPLPYIARAQGVEDRLSGDERPDATRHRLHVVDGRDASGEFGHAVSLTSRDGVELADDGLAGGGTAPSRGDAE